MSQASRGDAAVDLAIKENPHLILLDVMLPGMSGLDVCRELRKKGIEAPIIMLTAKGEEIDRVLGLEIGADDYVTKPFSLRELIARIGVRLRRHPPGLSEGVSKYRFGEVEIDFDKCQATRRGAPVELTHKELDILRLFIRRRGEVLTRDRMLDEVWGYDSVLHDAHRGYPHRQAPPEARAGPRDPALHPFRLRRRLQVRRLIGAPSAAFTIFHKD